MDATEADQQTYFPQGTEWKPKPNQNKGKFSKGKPQQHCDEIVYSKGLSFESMPSLSKQLEQITTPIVGLKYVWEYRSPSMSVAPLYHCKVCNVHQFQGHMLAHISGWKHSLRYIKKDHPDKITFTEEDVGKDPSFKKTLKEVTAELATSVGKGQLKVIFKEPSCVPAFKGLLSASQKQTLRNLHDYGPKSRGGFRNDGFGGYASLPPPPNYNLDQGPFYGMGYHNPDRGEFEGYEQGGPSGDYHEYRERPMNTLEQPRLYDGGDISGTLLGYLDTFKIENESDAQLVLKVTQKLTDILMEYRLRPTPEDTNMPQSFIAQDQRVPPGFHNSPPRMPKFNEPFSGYQGPSRYSGSPRYSGPPQRYSGAPSRY